MCRQHTYKVHFHFSNSVKHETADVTKCGCFLTLTNCVTYCCTVVVYLSVLYLALSLHVKGV